jgi:hypothetical protein
LPEHGQHFLAAPHAMQGIQSQPISGQPVQRSS